MHLRFHRPGVEAHLQLLGLSQHGAELIASALPERQAQLWDRPCGLYWLDLNVLMLKRDADGGG